MSSVFRISIIGTGNAGFRLAFALKSAGFEIPFVINRSVQAAVILASILNKLENNPYSLSDTHASDKIIDGNNSDIILISVSDDAITSVLPSVRAIKSVAEGKTTVCHISGGTSIDVLKAFPSYGVFYPLMTLSKNKPVDFTLVPFMLECSDEESKLKLRTMCNKLGSEFSFSDSEERMRMHVAAVFVSNFVNYLATLSYEISLPNHVYLLPLALETIRKAFLYGNPEMVQTGPAIRGDSETVNKHLEILKDKKNHFIVYKLLSDLIIGHSKMHNDVKFQSKTS